MTDLTLDAAEGPVPAGSTARGSAAHLHQYASTKSSFLNARQETHPGLAHARESLRIPRIAIDAFYDSPDVAASLNAMAADRLLARTRVCVHDGGMVAAIRQYDQTSTPNLVVVESRSSGQAFLAELDRLAEVCDPGTKVLAIGHTNDISLYRELLKRGVSEYLLAPIDSGALIEAISRIYSDVSAQKLGQVYAFIGARGGAGSSTLAHNVAWTLARRLKSDVVLADMDLPFGTASLDFNLDPGQGVAEAIKDVSRLDDVLLDRLLTKCGDNLSLLSAPAELGTSYDLNEHSIERLLEVAQSSVPFMILDIPHLWTAWARNTLITVDEIVITATPDLTSLRNAKSLINTLKQAHPHDPPPKLILNQVGMPKRPEIKPADFAKAVQLDPLDCIPFEPNLFGTAANKGQMIAQISAKSQTALAIGRITEAVMGRQEQRQTRKAGLGFASLLAGLRRRPANSRTGKK